MRFLARIEIISDGSEGTLEGTLYVDLLTNPAQLVLNRSDMGVLHLNPAELRHLTAILHDVISAWDKDTELFFEVDNSGGTLFLDVLTDPPMIIVWRTSAGLVRIELAEVRHLVEVLTLPAWILAVIEERDKSQRRDGGLCEQ